MDFLDGITKKIILNKLRLRCGYCYSSFSDDAYVGFVNKFFTHKNFQAYNKKTTKERLYNSHKLIISDKSMYECHSESIYFSDTNTYSTAKAQNFGKVVQIELLCDKCYNIRFYEIDLEKLSGNNHWA